MTPDEETYFHLVLCSDDLNEAWSTLNAIKENRGSPLVGAAFRYALIAYARPYLRSRGNHGGHRILDERFIPPSLRGLHRGLIIDRNQIHAHSDVVVRDATLHVARIPSGRWVGAVQRVIRGTEELENIDVIVSLVEGSLDAIYKELRHREEVLPFND